MSYHRAKILPAVQPMRRFANAHSVWARQLRTTIPNETVAYNARGGRAIGNYTSLPWPLGGLGAAPGVRVEAPKAIKWHPAATKTKPLGDAADGLGSTLMVI